MRYIGNFILTFRIQPMPIQPRQASNDNTEFASYTIQKAKMLSVCSVWCVKTYETKDGDE